MFAAGCRREVFGGCTNDARRKCSFDRHIAAFEEFKETLSVFFFLIGGFLESQRDLNEAVTFRLAGEVRIAIPRRRFADERL